MGDHVVATVVATKLVPVRLCSTPRRTRTYVAPSSLQQSQVHSRHALDCLHELTGGLLPPGKYPLPPCSNAWLDVDLVIHDDG